MVLTLSTPVQLTTSMADGGLDRMEAHELELYGIAELAKRWGVKKQRADTLSKRMTAPKVLACGRIWTGDQVRAFEKTWTRKTGVHVGK